MKGSQTHTNYKGYTLIIYPVTSLYYITLYYPIPQSPQPPTVKGQNKVYIVNKLKINFLNIDIKLKLLFFKVINVLYLYDTVL